MNNLEEIYLGSAPNAKDGDDALTGGGKINAAIRVLNHNVPVWKAQDQLLEADAPHYRMYLGKIYIYVGSLPEVTLLADTPDVSNKWQLFGEYVEEQVSKGFKTLPGIQLTANTPYEFQLPANSRLYALEIGAAASVIVGTTSGGDEIGDYAPTAPAVWQLGFIIANSVFIQSDVDVAVEPIIFQK